MATAFWTCHRETFGRKKRTGAGPRGKPPQCPAPPRLVDSLNQINQIHHYSLTDVRSVEMLVERRVSFQTFFGSKEANDRTTPSHLVGPVNFQSMHLAV